MIRTINPGFCCLWALPGPFSFSLSFLASEPSNLSFNQEGLAEPGCLYIFAVPFLLEVVPRLSLPALYNYIQKSHCRHLIKTTEKNALPAKEMCNQTENKKSITKAYRVNPAFKLALLTEILKSTLSAKLCAQGTNISRVTRICFTIMAKALAKQYISL